MSSRHYNFEVPVHISGFYAGFVPGKLQEAKLWDPLPNSVKWTMYNAAESHSELVLTKADLDSIDDHTWAAIYQLVQGYL
jgi:hypothetical protein